ncbi:PDDEXK nuclease domain-containing protein [Nocardioides dubius]|uniref:PDDEXK nuclease domain-containing protein n=1 Tax=Nocardioides dubius TaxID=317019 RepID=A0ABN1U165_9ACTN
MADRDRALTDPPRGYLPWLVELKGQIRATRLRAALAVDAELLCLYWRIGRDILERQADQGWGAKVIDRLSRDLREEFPEMKGFSVRSLKYMRSFAAAWPDEGMVQQVAARIPWGHNLVLLDRLGSCEERSAYAQAARENGWSRSALETHIEARSLERQGRAVTNFAGTLPSIQSDLARECLKDPYKLDFLGLGDDAHERDIERAVIDHLTHFLVELGAGFAYVGGQVLVQVGGDDFFIDLLFYHLKLRCYLVVEIKAIAFKPEQLGQLAFYMTAVDEKLKHDEDAPTLGLILCKTKNEVVAEYALRDYSKPLGVAEYRLIGSLPEPLRASLPTIEEIERGFERLPPTT